MGLPLWADVLIWRDGVSRYGWASVSEAILERVRELWCSEELGARAESRTGGHACHGPYDKEREEKASRLDDVVTLCDM